MLFLNVVFLFSFLFILTPCFFSSKSLYFLFLSQKNTMIYIIPLWKSLWKLCQTSDFLGIFRSFQKLCILHFLSVSRLFFQNFKKFVKVYASPELILLLAEAFKMIYDTFKEKQRRSPHDNTGTLLCNEF